MAVLPNPWRAGKDQHGANEDMLSFFRADLTETWDKIDICMFMVYMTLH
jgi:hypothetical protein